MNQEVKKAFTDVIGIINNMSNDTRKKIPLNFVQFIEENQDKNYKTQISYDIPLEQQTLSINTKMLLNYLYNNFLVNK